MNPEILTEYSSRSKWFAIPVAVIGTAIMIFGIWSYVNFWHFPETPYTPNELQSGFLCTFGLVLLLACLFPWLRDSTVLENADLTLGQQAQLYADEIETLKERLRDANLAPDLDSNLQELLVRFFRQWSRYGFNVSRIKNWGGQRQGFEVLANTDSGAIHSALNKLVAQGVVRTRMSRKGNVLYQIERST